MRYYFSRAKAQERHTSPTPHIAYRQLGNTQEPRYEGRNTHGNMHHRLEHVAQFRRRRLTPSRHHRLHIAKSGHLRHDYNNSTSLQAPYRIDRIDRLGQLRFGCARLIAALSPSRRCRHAGRLVRRDWAQYSSVSARPLAEVSVEWST